MAKENFVTTNTIIEDVAKSMADNLAGQESILNANVLSPGEFPPIDPDEFGLGEPEVSFNSNNSPQGSTAANFPTIDDDDYGLDPSKQKETEPTNTKFFDNEKQVLPSEQKDLKELEKLQKKNNLTDDEMLTLSSTSTTGITKIIAGSSRALLRKEAGLGTSICCFITPFGPCQRIASKKQASENKSEAKYRMFISERMNIAKYDGIILKYPKGIVEAVDAAPYDAKDAIVQSKLSKAQKADAIWRKEVTDGFHPIEVEIFSAEDALRFIKTTCAGFCMEDPAIFRAYTTKAGDRLNTWQEYYDANGFGTQYLIYNKSSAHKLKTKTITNKDGDKSSRTETISEFEARVSKLTNVCVLKSNYRDNKLITPNNYIAAVEYKSFQLSETAYAPDKATELNDMYLKALMLSDKKISDTKLKLHTVLLRSQSDFVSVAAGEVVGSKLFTIEGAPEVETLLNEDAVHWYDKKSRLTRTEISLVEKFAVKQKVKGSDGYTTTLKDKQIPFGEAGNKFAPESKHAAIHVATNKTLTEEKIKKFISDIASMSSSTGSSKKNYSANAAEVDALLDIADLVKIQL